MSRPFDPRLVIFLSAVTLIPWFGAALWPESSSGLWLDGLSWILGAWGAVWLIVASTRRSKPETSGRVLRRESAIGLALYALGLTLWTAKSALGSPLVSAVSELFLMSLGPAVSLALYRSWLRRPGARHIPGIQLDATLMTLGILALCLALYLPSVSGWSWYQLLVMLAGPVGLFGAFSLGLTLALHDHGPFQPGRFITLGALFGAACTWTAWNLVSVYGTPTHGTLLNLSFSVEVLALGSSLGTWGWTRRLQAAGWKSGVLALLPLIGPVFGCVALVIAVESPSTSGLVKGMFAGLLIVLFLVSSVRQWTLFRALREAHWHRARNNELEVTLAQLKQTQDQLVQSAKMAALGQLIAGITHDLNSPLGAIRSSSVLLQTIMKEQAAATNTPVETLDEDQLGVYRRLVEALSPDQTFLDSRTEREWKRRLAERAVARGHSGADLVASALIEAGLADQEDLVEAVLALPNPRPVVEALDLQATAHRLASVIQQATDRASKVVVSLHNFLRSGGEGERIPVDVADSVREVLPLFQHKIKQGLELVTALQGDHAVLAWPDKLSQVWVNLITNAIQAVGSEGVIEVSVTRDRQTVVVTVADNGPGVPAEVKHRVFEPFFTTKSAGQGTGLGLDVCRRVVAELGGSITLDSQPGHTVFEVRLPAVDDGRFD